VKDYPQATPTALSARPTPTPTTSLRSAKPSWHRAARTTGAVAETRQRVLLFVAGGMTYSEMREAYLLSSQLGRDVFIGAWNGPWYMDSNELTKTDDPFDSTIGG
jgi:syntaxin-binding protein 1